MRRPTIEDQFGRWRSGQRVDVRGAVWDIVEHTPFRDCRALRLSHVGSGTERTLLVPFDRPRLLDAGTVSRGCRTGRWLQALRRVACRGARFGAIDAAACTRIQVLPYQLEPALAMLAHGATRVLLADGVGLGKTIQAGLLLATLAARESFRAMVVAPAGLRDQWRGELTERFRLSPTIADADWLRATVRELPPDVNPWTLPAIAIASIDFLKRPEVLSSVETLTWDLLVVDEAHAAAAGTDRRQAVHALAGRARRVLLLTATPHSGDRHQFDALCRIGRLDADADLVVFRRTRDDVLTRRERKRRAIGVGLTADERRMHRLLERYTAAVCRDARIAGSPLARVAAIVLRKRALSSAGALALSVKRRLALLAGTRPASAAQLRLPLSDEIDDEVDDAVLGAPGLRDAGAEREWLDALAKAADAAASHESKIRFLRRWISRVAEPLVVFTEYRDTLERLAGAVEGSGPEVRRLHGGMSARARVEAQQAFNTLGGLLLATDAAAEGLNLHGTCRMVLHFELPWNPNRLEQRAGRVDRLGQPRQVHEVALVARDTAERLVLAPLARRAARARAALDGRRGQFAGISESRVAEAVLDGSPVPESDVRGDRPRSTPHPDGLAAEAEAEAARLVRVRDWVAFEDALRRRGERPGACVITSRRGAGPALAVFMARLVTPDGRVVHTEAVAIALEAAAFESCATLDEHRRQIESTFRGVALDAAAPRLAAVERTIHRCGAALDRRETLIAAHAASAARQMVQGRLFERPRADRAGRHRAGVWLTLESDGPAPARNLGREIELAALLLPDR